MSTLEFQEKVNSLTPILRRFAFSLTKNAEDAKDLFQETAFRAYNNMEKYRHGTNLKAWLFTIMKNIFINNYRKKAKASTIHDSTDNQYYLNIGSVSIDNTAEQEIMLKELHLMVERLDESLRVPFILHYQGFKYLEIAAELNVPLGTVKSRIFFARRELKAMIHARYDTAFKSRDRAS